jgi:hypothetical protein
VILNFYGCKQPFTQPVARQGVHLFISIKEDKNVQAGKKKDIEPKEHVIQHRVRVCNEKVNKE